MLRRNTKKDIEELAQHLIVSKQKSKGKNALWRHFGFTKGASPLEAPKGGEEKLDALMAEVANLGRRLDGRPAENWWAQMTPEETFGSLNKKVMAEIEEAALRRGMSVGRVKANSQLGQIEIWVTNRNKQFEPAVRVAVLTQFTARVQAIGERYGIDVVIHEQK